MYFERRRGLYPETQENITLILLNIMFICGGETERTCQKRINDEAIYDSDVMLLYRNYSFTQGIFDQISPVVNIQLGHKAGFMTVGCFGTDC